MPRSIPPLQWPKIYEMVDMEGLDLAEANGHAVSGIYAKITSALGSDNLEYWYNTYFAGILIPPGKFYINTEVSGQYVINGVILIKSDDTISLVGLTPDPPVIAELTVTENGTYNTPQGVDGFDPVSVNVPSISPVLVTLNALQNGQYLPATGQDGFNIVNVNVPDIPPVLETLSVTENGTYTPSQGYDGFSEVSVAVESGSVVLPTEYQKVEYIQFSGQEWFDFAPDLTHGDRYAVTEVSLDAFQSDNTWFANGYNWSLTVQSTTKIYVYMSSGLNLPCRLYSNDSAARYGTYISSPSLGTKYSVSSKIPTQYSAFYVGCWNSSHGEPFYGKIYRLDIYDGFFELNAYYRLIPCYRKADNVVGFCDVVNDVFYTNQGPGAFIAGPDIN